MLLPKFFILSEIHIKSNTKCKIKWIEVNSNIYIFQSRASKEMNMHCFSVTNCSRQKADVDGSRHYEKKKSQNQKASSPCS